MKNQETKKSKKKVLLYYLILAACLLIIAAVTITVIFTVKGSAPRLSVDSGQEQPDDGENPPDDGDDEPTTVDTSFLAPVKTVSVANVFEFFHNETLDWYYLHEGFDFAGSIGDEVYAMQNGKVLEVVYDTDPASVLFSGYLVIDHGNNVVATYKFIDIADGIGRGSEITRGQLIGRLSPPTGTEAFADAHLHLEIREDGELVDPETFLEIIGK
ncbi:MAG: peptidoglycan DD-metalloendopeptidase family protein [Clostridia bacterium]|nr:peptidoglycan DD-metalloendopeptidase family protein [Clostridia bacterium]